MCDGHADSGPGKEVRGSVCTQELGELKREPGRALRPVSERSQTKGATMCPHVAGALGNIHPGQLSAVQPADRVARAHTHRGVQETQQTLNPVRQIY